MKIAHFNSHMNGGAAIAARRLHESLVERGIDSTFYSKSGSRPDASYALVFTDEQTIYTWMKRRFEKWRMIAPAFRGRPEGYEQFSLGWQPLPTPLQRTGATPSIVHMHWIADFIDYPSFFASIPDDLPIVWTLHDMNPFTGGCHYSWECGKYQQGCYACPQLGPAGRVDLAARNSRVKAEAIAAKNIHVVADSHWLEGEARKSALFSNVRSFRTIHYGLDTERFIPRDTVACRMALGLDHDALIIAFGADDIENRRKGMALLFESLDAITSDRQVVVLVFGHGQELPLRFERFTVRNVGFVQDPALMSIIHSASDVFIIPSLYEAFGQTALEAMACGTPVVGFDTGGIPDMISHGETGLLARPGDAADLAEKIQWMVDHKSERRAMGTAARLLVEREYTLAVQASRYLGLYRSL